MSESRNMREVVGEFATMAENVYNKKNLELPEYLEFLQCVEVLKKSEAFQKSSACFENSDQSLRVVWDIPKKYSNAAAYLVMQKKCKNAIPINFCDMTMDQFRIFQDCLGFLYCRDGEPNDPQVKHICM